MYKNRVFTFPGWSEAELLAELRRQVKHEDRPGDMDNGIVNQLRSLKQSRAQGLYGNIYGPRQWMVWSGDGVWHSRQSWQPYLYFSVWEYEGGVKLIGKWRYCGRHWMIFAAAWLMWNAIALLSMDTPNLIAANVLSLILFGMWLIPSHAKERKRVEDFLGELARRTQV